MEIWESLQNKFIGMDSSDIPTHERSHRCFHYQTLLYIVREGNLIHGLPFLKYYSYWNLSWVTWFLKSFLSPHPIFPLPNSHESARSYYRTSAFFLAKVFADLVPNRILPVLLFSSIAYFMMGLKPEAESFFLYVLSLSLTNLAAVSMAFLVSASVNTFAVANLLIALPYVFMMVFGGFLVNLNTMLDWLSWIKWISIYRYGMNALTINELKGLVFYLNSTGVPGELYLEQQDIDYSTWGFWENELALFCLATVFLFFSYIQLLRINRWK